MARAGPRMNIHYINLDRSTDRLATFMALNGHLGEITRFPAIDGGGLDIPRLIRDGKIDQGVTQTYTRGALGSAFSHFTLWDKAIESNRFVTICEDDAIFNRQFDRTAGDIIKTLPPDWDVIVWAWNFDAFLMFELLPGVSACLAQFDQDRMRLGVGKFQEQTISARPFKLVRSLGAICYSISPRGVRSLKPHCLPIREMTVFYPGLDRNIPNFGIDIMMASAYPKINAFVSFPPLVIAKNESSKSTVQRQPT